MNQSFLIRLKYLFEIQQQQIIYYILLYRRFTFYLDRVLSCRSIKNLHFATSSFWFFYPAYRSHAASSAASKRIKSIYVLVSMNLSRTRMTRSKQGTLLTTSSASQRRINVAMAHREAHWNQTLNLEGQTSVTWFMSAWVFQRPTCTWRVTVWLLVVHDGYQDDDQVRQTDWIWRTDEVIARFTENSRNTTL